MRVGTLFRLLAWSYCAYYIYYIAIPSTLHLYEVSPDLWNIRCGRTWLSWLSSIPFVSPGGRFLETACCVGSHCVAVAHMPSEFAKVRVARSLDQYIDYWCDSNDYSWLTFGKSGVCHFT